MSGLHVYNFSTFPLFIIIPFYCMRFPQSKYISADPGQRKGERAREERCLEQQQRRRRRRPPSTGAKAAKMLGFSWLSEGPFGTLSRFEAFIKVALRLPFCGFSGWTWGYWFQSEFRRHVWEFSRFEGFIMFIRKAFGVHAALGWRGYLSQPRFEE